MLSKLVLLCSIIVLCKCFDANYLKLKQVLIFSRHNIRYSLQDKLNRFTPKVYPPQDGPAGLLTPKGAQLEGYMGEYFAEWFKKEQFLPEDCPDQDTVYVYTNTLNRTKDTARAFIDSAFRSCNVTVHHKDSEEWDPLFSCEIRNSTKAFKDTVIKEVNRKLKNNFKLTAGYSELNKILEIEGSDVCKQDGICDLNKANNTIICEVGETLSVEGPLSVAFFTVDSFLMSYYNGKPIHDIAWGQIKTPEKWKLLIELVNQALNITYTTVAEDVAAPLVEYLTETFKNYDKKPKFMLMVGHDTNMNTLASVFGFKPIDLLNQFENFPIGGKFVFQRWTDGESDYLKVEFVYPSWSQIRTGSKFSLESPPQRVVMRLNWCNTDKQGFCPWKEFVGKL